MKQILMFLLVLVICTGSLWADEAWKVYTFPESDTWFYYPRVFEDHDGQFWATAAGSVYWLDSNDVWQVVVDSAMLDSNTNYTFHGEIIEDHVYHKWFICDQDSIGYHPDEGDHMVRYDGTTFTYYTMPFSHGGDNLFCSCVDTAGAIWAGGWGFAFKFDGNEWSRHEVYNYPYREAYVTDMEVDKNGALLVAYGGGGHSGEVGGLKTPTDSTDFYFTRTGVFSLSIDSRNRYWAVLGGSLEVYADGTWSYPSPPPPESLDGRINQVVCDSLDNIWVSYYYSWTEQGCAPIVSRFDGEIWQHIQPEGFEQDDDQLKVIYVDSAGRIWFAARNKLLVYDAPADPVRPSPAPSTVADFQLYPVYPNPFNAGTRLSYEIKKTMPVILTLYNSTGKEVIQLVSQQQMPGRYQLNWDGRDAGGNSVSTGVYFCVLKTAAHQQTTKLLLLQ